MNLSPKSLTHALRGMAVASLLTLCLVFGASASQPGTILADQVNLRNEPSAEASVVNWLNTGDTVDVLDTSTEGWVKVSYTVDSTKYVGYVSSEFIEVGISTNDTPTVNNAGITQTATITGGGVRVRKEPNTDSAILALIADGKVVTILDESIDGWIKVSFQENEETIVGFIASDYLFTNPMATGVTARSSIILRESNDNSSPIVAILPADTELDILDSVDDWYKVSHDDQMGYVRKSLLSTENDSASIGYGTVTADNLTLRSSPSTDGDNLALLPYGTTFQITSNDTEGWYGARFNGKSGYVSAEFVAFSEGVSSGYVQVAASSLTLRAGAGTAFAKIMVIPEGSVLPVSGTYGNWFQVTYGGYTGYVSGAYVSSTTSEGYRYYPNFAKISTASLMLRKSPSTDAELMAAIAEGVVVEVISKDYDWYKVKYDGMTGFILASYTVESNGPATVIVHEAPASSSGSSGSSGSGNSTGNRKSSSSGSGKDYSGGSTVSGSSGSAVVDYAMQFVGNPYVWGGTSLTRGCDCSGFVMSVYAHFGVSLPHSSAALRSVGKGVSYSEARPGDIICYNHHVGIYVGNGQIVNALGKKYGIVVSSATYKSIITVRRIFS